MAVSFDLDTVEPVKYKIYKPIRTYKKGACKTLINSVYYEPEHSTVSKSNETAIRLSNPFKPTDYYDTAFEFDLLKRFGKEYDAYKDLINDTIGLTRFLQRRDSNESLSSIIEDCESFKNSKMDEPD